MELKTIIIDGIETDIALKVDEDYYEKNDNNNELENTLRLDIITAEEGNDNE